MTLNPVASFSWRGGLFVLLQSIAFVTAALVLMQGAELSNLPDQADIIDDNTVSGQADRATRQLVSLMLVTFAQAIALAMFFQNRPTRTPMNTAIIAVVAFVAGTILTQIETAVFIGAINRILLFRIIALGLVTSISAAVFGALLFRTGPDPVHGRIFSNQTTVSVARITLYSTVHMIAYFVIGYWVVWIDGDARAYYGGGALLSFPDHITQLIAARPDLFGLQIMRGAIWACLSILLAATVHADRIKLAIVVFSLYFSFSCAPLLIDNPLMPENIRMLHLVETSITVFILSGLAVIVFRRPAEPPT